MRHRRVLGAVREAPRGRHAGFTWAPSGRRRAEGSARRADGDTT